MNAMLRSVALVAGIGGAAALGYFLGTITNPGHLKSASAKTIGTPLPLPSGDSSNASLTSTAMGRMIDGKSDFQRLHLLLNYANTLDAAALPGAINEAMQLPLQQRNIALGILIGRWAELDPAAAVQYTQLLPKSANAAQLRKTALQTWADKDLDAALTWAQTLPKGEVRNGSLITLAGSLAKRDPQAALKLIGENFTGRDASSAYDSVFSSWAETDFATAYTAAQGITDASLRTRAMRSALGQKVESDPRLVVEAVRTSKNSEIRWDLANRAMSRWLERDFATARDYALALPIGEMRDQALAQVAREMVSRDPKDALDWLGTLPDDSSRDQALQGLFSSWANTNPAAAVEAAQALTDPRMRDAAMANLAQQFVDSDLTTALSLLKALPSGNATDSALMNVAWRWARNDPKSAADWFLANAPENNRWAMNQIVSEWSRSDPETSLQWAANLPVDRSDRDELLGIALGQFGRANPAAATAYIEKLAPEQQANVVGNFLSNWASRDAAAAARWAATLSAPEAQQNAMSTVAHNWAQRDPTSTAHWLETLPAGAGRDSAVQSFVNNAVQKDPEGALAWVMTMSAADRRDGALMSTLSTWARKDEQAAQGWLQSAPGLTPETRARMGIIISEAKRRGGISRRTYIPR